MPHSSLCHQVLALGQTPKKDVVIFDGWLGRDQLGVRSIKHFPEKMSCELDQRYSEQERENTLHLRERDDSELAQKESTCVEQRPHLFFPGQSWGERHRDRE